MSIKFGELQFSNEVYEVYPLFGELFPLGVYGMFNKTTGVMEYSDNCLPMVITQADKWRDAMDKIALHGGRGKIRTASASLMNTAFNSRNN